MSDTTLPASPTSEVEAIWDLEPLAELLHVEIEPAASRGSQGEQITFSVGNATVTVEMYAQEKYLCLEVSDKGWSGSLMSSQPPEIDGDEVAFPELTYLELYLGSDFLLEAEGTLHWTTLTLDLSHHALLLSDA